MSLSSDLISQFVKITKDTKPVKQESLIYGTIRIDKNKKTYVQLDGADANNLIPIDKSSSTCEISAEAGDRVIIFMQNHKAVIIGNVSKPSAQLNTVEGIKVDLKKIDTLAAENVEIKKKLIAHDGEFNLLKTDNLTINNTLKAVIVDVDYLKTNTLTAEQIKADYAKIEDLAVTNEKVFNLEATYGEFKDLTTEKFETTDAFMENANITFANIDFSNIGEAAIEHLFATSGLIENIVVGDGTITGNLVGVTIKGDLIEANTLVADKLVIQGEDGLYYKLNTDGVTVEGEQTEYNSLNGSIITAKSITATQISVDDLVAFDATIGGFTIGENSIHSEVKDSEGNTTRGIYMDTDGQVNFGDELNFIKYYKDEDGTYKLAISAASILYALNGKQYSVADLGQIGEYVHVGTYEDEPCIELGESDSDFKLVITNTRILFMEGSSVPAYINNQSLHITKAVIEEEIQQGEFVWKVRANGNMGLVWKGET